MKRTIMAMVLLCLATGARADIISDARQYIGKTAHEIGVRSSLWCAAFINKITKGGTHSDLAKSYLKYQHTKPATGTIAVLDRDGGGHVGVVSGFDKKGNPILISGNTCHGRCHGARVVAEGAYPKGNVIAYVVPPGETMAALEEDEKPVVKRPRAVRHATRRHRTDPSLARGSSPTVPSLHTPV